MEIGNTKENTEGAINSSENTDLIKVRAVISCPSCGYMKKFRNQFRRSQIELMVISLKCFDWMCCHLCGELLDLNLEFVV